MTGFEQALDLQLIPLKLSTLELERSQPTGQFQVFPSGLDKPRINSGYNQCILSRVLSIPVCLSLEIITHLVRALAFYFPGIHARGMRTRNRYSNSNPDDHPYRLAQPIPHAHPYALPAGIFRKSARLRHRI